MLKPEAAKERLQQWEIKHEPEGETAPDRFLTHVAKLPKPLRTAGYALLGRDAEGKELSWRNWEERERQKNEACVELDALSAEKRIGFFQSFFPRLAAHVEQGWQLLKRTPYQHGYARKAFRAPNHPRATLPKRIDWLEGLFSIAGTYQSEVLTAPWLASWAPHLEAGYGNDQDRIGQLLAAVIDAGGPLGQEVFDILAQSLRNEHEIGGMGRHVTRALLLAQRTDGWELMEKTLLAAQRQEGLRQAILETIDEAHPQAFRRMLRLIQENDLARFSAVVRAVNVWFGYLWDSVSVKVVNDAMAKALRFLDDEAARMRALQGKDAEDAFLALWSIAFEDAHAAMPLAGKLLKHPKVEHRYVAALHLTQLGLPETHAVRLPALEDADLRVAWCALSGLSAGEEDEPDQLSAGQDLFERLERLYARLPEKPTDTKPLVWPWTAMRLDRRVVTGQLLDVLGDRLPTRLLPYLSSLHPYLRSRVVELLAQQKKWDRLTRDSLLDLAGDSSSDVRQASFNALAKQPLEHGEPQRLEGYLTRKTSDLRRGAIALLAKQKDADALASADRLLTAKDAQQRLAGLELLRQLAEADRQRKSCQERATAYKSSRKQLSKEEQTQLSAIADSERERITLDNGLGLFNPAERSPVVPPQKRNVPFITDAAIACLKDLDELVHAHRETKVSYDIGDQPVEQLLGAFESGLPTPEWHKPPDQCKQPFPLRELWEEWHDRRGKDLRDKDGLELVRAQAWADISEFEWEAWQNWSKRSGEHRQIVRTLSGGKAPPELRYQSIVGDVLEWLVYLNPPRNTVDVLLDAVETSFALVPAELQSRLVELATGSTSRCKTRSAIELVVGQLAELETAITSTLSEPVLNQLAEVGATIANAFEDVEDEDKAEPDWRDEEPFKFWLEMLQRCVNLAKCKPTPEQWARYWQLMHWRDEPIPGALRERPDTNVLKDGYAAGAATQADWYDQLLGPHAPSRYGASFGDLREMTSLRSLKENEAYFQRCPEIRALVDRCRERILEIELGRGEAATAATQPALDLQSLYGADTLLRILSALGKPGFKIESGWNESRRLGRAATLTHLAGITYPQATDTPADFAEKLRAAVAGGHVPEERVLELAFHAPQWSRFIEAYLAWPRFSEGLYWFLAHMKYIGETGTQAAIGAGVSQDSKDDDGDSWNKPSAWDRLIMERTPLTGEERREGAVDVGWFQKTYAQLTPKRWEAMAKAARFAANPAQAKRAQLIADVLLGRASRKELIAGIRKKYLKENVRLLGLLPLSAGPKRDADLAERYRVLQDYRRYAKQLSSMTKEGALRAVDIGMQNLARTAGFPDPLRLEWAMEADSVKDLARGSISATRDGITVTLGLDERAAPQLTVRRGDKELKSIPPEIKKKDKSIARLAERVTELKRQSSRMRQSLESAMCRGDKFNGTELVQLCQHALLAPLLTRLVLIGEGIMGYPDKGGKALRDCRGKLEPVKKTETFRLAHPHDLLATDKWDAWQHECFQAERVQPFKQVFRELYVVTKQEKADGMVSRRYAGQQVNPKQAYALWGQRGWNTKDGVWRTFYDLGITASVGFNYGVTTPLEVEGLTIETIQFSKREALEPLKLTAVPPRAFSEVMRDLDLVVSVAHRGEVDPEASASTVEMRAKLLGETCKLLQLKNVRLKDSHALVDGELGRYSIHLGSAVVHKLPGGALCIVPVHAQHRGRLFLPFADDDPKTAEVVSKVLLLARDTEIQDPVILDQLRHAGV